MKAVVYTKYGSPDVLRLSDVEKPKPKDNEILVKIFATTVTPVDCAFRKGEPPIARLFTGLTKPKNPILGSEFSGEVEAVGRDVTRFKEGDQVFGAASSTHAEYVVLAADGPVYVKPATVSLEEIAAIPYGTLTALPFLRDHAKLQRGQTILVNGAAGSIGTFAVQLAKHLGAEVVGVCSTSNLGLVKSLGADAVIDYTCEDFTANAQRYDVIFDVVGKLSFQRCRGSLTPTGTYLTTVSTPAIIPQMLWTSRTNGKKAVFAATGLRPVSKQADDLRFIRKLVEQEKITTVIDRRYPLAQIADAHRCVEQGHKRGNIIVRV